MPGIPGAPGPQQQEGKDEAEEGRGGGNQEAWREGEGKKEIKGHVVIMVHLEWRDLKNIIVM